MLRHNMQHLQQQQQNNYSITNFFILVGDIINKYITFTDDNRQILSELYSLYAIYE